MPGIRPEDAKVKIPALIHLSRLGYQYTPLAGIVRDRDTNILPEDLRQAIAQINGSEMNDAAFEKLLSEIGKSLGQEDLGRAFSNGLQQGWNGTRVIDFAHPDRNLYPQGIREKIRFKYQSKLHAGLLGSGYEGRQ